MILRGLRCLMNENVFELTGGSDLLGAFEAAFE